MSERSYPTKLELDIPDDWNLTMANTDEGPMVVRLNKGYEQLKGHPDYGYQVGIAVALNRPTEAGLHDVDEGIEVGDIEDMLAESLEKDKLALFVFSQCSCGVKEWVYYTGKPDAVVPIIEEITDKVKTHQIQMIIQDDPQWEIYQEFNISS